MHLLKCRTDAMAGGSAELMNFIASAPRPVLAAVRDNVGTMPEGCEADESMASVMEAMDTNLVDDDDDDAEALVDPDGWQPVVRKTKKKK